MSNHEIGAAAWLDGLLARAVEGRASDLHLMTGERPWVRLDGDLIEIEDLDPVTADAMDAALRRVAEPSQLDALAAKGEVDLAYTHGDGHRARVSAFREEGGAGLAFRLLGGRPPSVAELELPSDILRVIYAQGGLVLFAGRAGAGKTTTLAAVLQELSCRRAVRLITLEDPIEFAIEPVRAYVEQRGLGLHVRSFAEGVREAIDASPDALAIGELRDLETIRRALEAAETGILVLATVHAHDTMRAVGRLIDAFPHAERHAARVSLAASLRMVAAQALVRRASGEGRVPAVEVCHGTTSLGALIREGKDHEIPSLIESSAGLGMRTVDDALIDLVRRARVRPEEAIAAAMRPDTVRRLIGPYIVGSKAS